MKCLTTALVMIMLLVASQYTFAEGTWTNFPGKYAYPDRLAVTSDGDVWISVAEVLRYDGETWTSFTDEGGFTPNTNNVFSIACSSEGDVWFGTRSGVTRYDGETWTNFYKGENGLPDSEAPCAPIAVTPSGIVWVAIDNVGVSRYDGETWTTFTKDDGLGSDWVRSIAVLSDDIVLFATSTNGISIYNGDSWSYFNADDGLISNYIRDKTS